MELLSVLEKKITALVALMHELQKEKSLLLEENTQLKAKIEMLEHSLLTDGEHLEKLNQERKLTKTVVDDLIKSIDLLVEVEKPQ